LALLIPVNEHFGDIVYMYGRKLPAKLRVDSTYWRCDDGRTSEPDNDADSPRAKR